MFYLVFSDTATRTTVIDLLKQNNIHAVFHYQSLHVSTFYKHRNDGRDLPLSDRYTDTLLRLPMYYDLEREDVELIAKIIKSIA